ncbi:hypothetical protein EJB05_27505 [Eragrostis curvula]|uniref:Uncharacterized protein n=1 Tax=Eragrostis curvula TaxID=38414 RepID=A0A5J9UMJ5_9POAL|nr:hypothetical protein EJB05_27505 [Eragrostis curvula]
MTRRMDPPSQLDPQVARSAMNIMGWTLDPRSHLRATTHYRKPLLYRVSVLRVLGKVRLYRVPWFCQEFCLWHSAK